MRNFLILFLASTVLIVAQTNIYEAGANVGIGGTPSVGAKFSIIGSAVNSTLLRLDAPGPGNGSYTNFADTSLGGQGFGRAFLRWTRDNNLGRAFSIFTSDYLGNSAERLIIDSQGNVGIGGSASSARLTLFGSNTNCTLLQLDASGPSNGYYVNFADVSLGGQGFGKAFLRWTRDNNLGRAFSIFTSDDVGNSAERLIVDTHGNVGIGTATPTQKLSVNGSIRAKEVIVETTDWSDYVFEENYNLVSLSLVEELIKREKRLPGMPSASEVAEKGIGLGEMQAKLLAKIEELTLRQIAQEKRLRALEEENSRLRLHKVRENT